jgi:hypothetical protein
VPAIPDLQNNALPAFIKHCRDDQNYAESLSVRVSLSFFSMPILVIFACRQPNARRRICARDRELAIDYWIVKVIAPESNAGQYYFPISIHYEVIVKRKKTTRIALWTMCISYASIKRGEFSKPGVML